MTYGKMAVEYEERINFDRMRKEKTERVRTLAKERGLEGILTLDSLNTMYITTGRGIGAVRYAFLPLNAEPVLFEAGWYEDFCRMTRPWLKVKCMIPAVGLFRGKMPRNDYEHQLQKFARQIRDEVKDHGLFKETIGIDTSDNEVVAALQKEGLRISTEGSTVMREAREIKTRDEVECFRTLASIIDGCFEEVKRAIRPGTREDQLIAIIAYTGYMLGAHEVAAASFRSGPRTWAGGGSAVGFSDRTIRPGDLVYMDISRMSYQGYRSCIYRTFSCGKPTQRQKEAYVQVKEWLYDAIKSIRPGATSKDLAEKWPEAREFGRPNEDGAILMQFAHGLGLENHEGPFITRAWSLEHPYPIKEDMVLAVETVGPTNEITSDYPNGQAVRLEEMVHVTKTGYEVLSKWPIDEMTVCEF